MSSVFKKTQEELKSQEIDTAYFSDLLEQGIKTCKLNQDLELLLYDVSDALKENQILLIEAPDGREEGYLIPLLLAYQNTTYFKRFIIAASSSVTRKAIETKIQELAKLLKVDIPVHTLESEKNYFCLKRLAGYNKKRKNPIQNCHPKAMSKDEWRKIQVRNCTLSSCAFFKKCKYAIDRTAISQNGCAIISHASLIGNKKYSQSTKAHEDGDIIIIEEAERFANSVRDSYQQLMSFDYIHNCFSRAKKLLNKPEYSFITNSYFIELKNFFEELALCEKGENWTVTPRLKEVSDKLATMTKKALIHLTRQGAVRNFSKEIEHFCEMIYIIEKFFEDIATSSGLFHCLLQENERSQDTPAFRKVQVFYYPNRVDSIIADSLKNKKCSIVFTGKRIAGKDSEYSSLSEECGIEELGKPVVKEYILK